MTSTSTGAPVVNTKLASYKQRRMGPAPIASFEDLNDDTDLSPEDKVPLKPMPEIREEVPMLGDGSLLSPESGAGSSLAGGGLQTPSTPRIDISRASSSSHHDSNNSSPERELYGEGEGAEAGSTLGAGFKEDGAADLRSSTEELNFHTETGTVQEREMLRRKQKHINKLTASTVFKYELEAQSEKERKDSTCSDLGLLSISGRTSRLSSVGSAASGCSGVSHLSNTSRLSVTGSHVSGVSGRSASPHKMLLETSFCGSTPSINQSVEILTPPGSNKHERLSMETVLLAKSTMDPTAAVIGGTLPRKHEKKSASEMCESVLVNGKAGSDSEGTIVSSKDDLQAQKPIVKECVKSSKSKETDGTFISLKYDLGSSMDREEKGLEKIPRSRECSETKSVKRNEKGKYLVETEGTFISLKYDLGSSLDCEEKGIEKPKSSKASGISKEPKPKETKGTYLRETEGTFISLKYDLGSSLDCEEKGIEKPKKLNESATAKKPTDTGGKYMQETEGKFISLKYDLGSSLDCEESGVERPKAMTLKDTSKSSKPKVTDGKYMQETEGKFISLKYSLDKEESEIDRPNAMTLRDTSKSSKPKLTDGKYMQETEGKFISLKYSLDKEESEIDRPNAMTLRDTSKSSKPKLTDGKYMQETEGKFISLKYSLDKEESEIDRPKAMTLKDTSKSSKPKVTDGKYMQETEGKFISLKYSLDKEESEIDRPNAMTLKDTSKSVKPKVTEGKYLQETEGKFISLKHDLGSSLDREENGIEKAPVSKESGKPKKSADPGGKYMQGPDGKFISLKYDKGSSLDRVESEIEKPKPMALKDSSSGKAKVTKGKYMQETEGTFISLKYDLGSSLDCEEKGIEKAPSPKVTSKPPKPRDDSIASFPSSKRDLESSREKPKEKRRTDHQSAPKDPGRTTRTTEESEGTFISLKYDLGSSQDREEKGISKPPSLKECGKSNALQGNEGGKYLRDVEGTFISLKYDLGSSLDREERGVEIPVTLNLTDSGKSVKQVQSFSQLVQKDSSRPKVQEPVRPRSVTPSASPKPARHVVLKKDEVGSRTPSPSSSSRKSSFTSLFKRNELGVLSPESPSVGGKRKPLTTLLKEAGEGLIDRSRTRSTSRDRSGGSSPLTVSESRDSKVKKDAKNKSVFSTFFKKKDRKKGTRDGDTLSPDMSSPEPTLPVLDAISNVEFTFNANGNQRSETAVGRTEDETVLHEDSLLPSESVMLPTLSHLYSDHKEPSVGKQIVKESRVELAEEKKRVVDDDDHHSSESERDSEMEYLGNKAEQVKTEVEEEEDHERKGFFAHQDSVDEELPYIPTTLPQERSIGVPLVPAKQRTLAEVRTCPIERPRSTTPINPSLLDEFINAGPVSTRELKMKISLPREDSVTSKKSPRRTSARSWFEFAEQGLQSPREYRKSSLTSATSPSPPPLPPRAHTTSPPTQMPPPPKVLNWINFEEIPEKRKPPKRIQTIPSRGNIEVAEPPRGDAKNVVYSYVNPEDCKCECHESSASTSRHAAGERSRENGSKCSHASADGRTPRLEVEDRNSCVSDSSVCEFVNPYTVELGEEYNLEGLKVMKPFGMDLDVSSNRSSIVSQDDQQSPDNDAPQHLH